MSLFKELSWAALLFPISGWDEAYKELFEDNSFLSRLHSKPNSISKDEFKKKVVTGFLNKWACRITDSSVTPAKKRLIELQNFFNVINRDSIQDLNFDSTVKISGENYKKDEVISHIYAEISKTEDFGLTSISKLMHVMNAKLFVMWDRKIFQYYKKRSNKIKDTGEGYVEFLKEVKKLASDVIRDFRAHGKTGNPESYLFRKLNLTVSKTLAKLLDEYNWIKITKEIELPPLDAKVIREILM